MTLKVYWQDETRIEYAIAKCGLGYVLVATTDKGICAVKLGDRSADLIEAFKTEFSNAEITRDNRDRNWNEQVLMAVNGKITDLDLPLDIRGAL